MFTGQARIVRFARLNRPGPQVSGRLSVTARPQGNRRMESNFGRIIPFLINMKKPKRRSRVLTTSFRYAVPSCPPVHIVSLSPRSLLAARSFQWRRSRNLFERGRSGKFDGATGRPVSGPYGRVIRNAPGIRANVTAPPRFQCPRGRQRSGRARRCPGRRRSGRRGRR